MTAPNHTSFDPHGGSPAGGILGGASHDEISQVNITICPDKDTNSRCDAVVEFRLPKTLKMLAKAKAKRQGKDLSKVLVAFVEDFVADGTDEPGNKQQVRQVQRATNGQLRRVVAAELGILSDLHNIASVADPGSPLAREAIHAILQEIESNLKQRFVRPR